MSYYDILADNFTSTAGMAVMKETSLEAGKHLIQACRVIVKDYCSCLYKENEYSDDDSINFTVIDLIAYLEDNEILFDHYELGKMLMCDRTLYEFIGQMIEGLTKFQSSWENMTYEKKERVILAYEIAENYYKYLEI
jgi:hypothetical protein